MEGGYKTTDEDYTYVRGRGRGRYVCNSCGIRCKKPSMLKKHIRTHSNFRPHTCKYCNFSFKTKGNLTKHMKSKAHLKKCVELGINPVPTNIDEIQGSDSDSKQVKFLIHEDDTQSRPVVLIIRDVCTSVSTFHYSKSRKQNQFKVRIVITTGGTASLAEGIIDEPCLLMITSVMIHLLI